MSDEVISLLKFAAVFMAGALTTIGAAVWLLAYWWKATSWGRK